MGKSSDKKSAARIIEAQQETKQFYAAQFAQMFNEGLAFFERQINQNRKDTRILELERKIEQLQSKCEDLLEEAARQRQSAQNLSVLSKETLAAKGKLNAFRQAQRRGRAR